MHFVDFAVSLVIVAFSSLLLLSLPLLLILLNDGNWYNKLWPCCCIKCTQALHLTGTYRLLSALNIVVEQPHSVLNLENESTTFWWTLTGTWGAFILQSGGGGNDTRYHPLFSITHNQVVNNIMALFGYFWGTSILTFIRHKIPPWL